MFSLVLSMTTDLPSEITRKPDGALVVEADLAGALDVELAAGLLAARAELHELAAHGVDAGEMVGDLLRGVGARRSAGRQSTPGPAASAAAPAAPSGKAEEAAPRGAEVVGRDGTVFMPVVTFVFDRNFIFGSIGSAVGLKFGDSRTRSQQSGRQSEPENTPKFAGAAAARRTH